jgi:hypothetical protein
MQEFSNQMKEAGEGGESLTQISLAISILAVLVAMVTVVGHRSHTEAVLSQAKASDMWNEYQAKKIRSYEAGVAMVQLTVLPNTNAAAVEKQIEEYRSQQDKWKDELAEEEEQAREFEDEVSHAEHQATRYDLGEALLQIGVVLCSITLFTRRKLYFILGLTLGVAGLLFAASALAVH